MSKKKKILIYVLVCFLILLFLVILLFKDKIFLNNDESKANECPKCEECICPDCDDYETKPDENEENDSEVDKLGKYYFAKFKKGYQGSHGDNGYYFIFTDEKKLNYDNLPYNEKFLFVTDSISESDYVENPDIPSDIDNYGWSIKKEVFERKYKELYGIDKNVKYSNELISIPNFELACEDSNDYVDCYGLSYGAIFDGKELFYDHAVIESEDLIVYVKSYSYISVYEEDDNGNTIFVISTRKGYNYSYLYDDYLKIDIQKVKEDIGDKLDTYKVVFKNIGNNSYYWYETDIID